MNMKMKMTFKPRDAKRKMGEEELQSYLKAKKLGNGAHKNKKAYNRKAKRKEAM